MNSFISPKTDTLIPLTVATIILGILVYWLIVLVAIQLYEWSIELEKRFHGEI